MIEYDQAPTVHFFLCRQCRAHIALTQEHVHTDIELEAGIFRNTVNVDVEDDPLRYRIVGLRTAADASCTRCSTHLGFKWVVVPDESMVVQGRKIHTGSEKPAVLGWKSDSVRTYPFSC
ncbi:uncharacterized protein LOC130770244 [Actinidia eriantha]|uniref:uncharacterized protein LOC130770244 n=1 Tax=Actinidia eriantha TaxID=165200 RepID=UPI00258BEA7A|nr:uncharacterized protein LOC130770244 [Actinidia eriantha]